MRIGHVTEVWRYPVKSMAGEQLDGCTVGQRGVVGDRGWALRDEAAQEIRGAKKLPSLLLCSARYLSEPTADRVPVAEITLPDGTKMRSDAPEAGARLSALLDRQVTIWPLRPADDLAHYQRGLPDNPDMERELRQVFGRLDDEPLPDLSVFPQEIFMYTSPLGTYFDALPLHVLTTATLAELGRRNPGARFDRRRFRPNFVVDPDGATGLVETGWCGKKVRLGSVTIAVEMGTARCVMTTLPQGDLPKDPSVLRTIVRDAEQNVGVYANVVTPGEVRVGDPVDVID